ncbi:MAG: tyrosine-type recombinase/integrase, partial [Nocardioidaceae bacterium]
ACPAPPPRQPGRARSPRRSDRAGAVELGVGVGRRTAELCSLRFDCLDYDEDGDITGEHRRSPILVHDMPKVDKVDCRLPIHEREAAIIAAQQARVAAEFPATTTRLLALFPRPLKNPDGTRPLATAHLQRAMREWVDTLPRLDAPERDTAGRPVPFPRDAVTPYAFRHSFAQRHADAGTPLDALKDLLGHDTVRTTLGYYRVTAKRKRQAQDRLGPLQLDHAGRLVRPGIDRLAEAEKLREDVGQVAVPFGICTEPTNVAAGGHSCPFRHRCTGCEYFRTDPSFQPELRAYLTHLLADRERLATAVPQLAEWARSEATPAVEEIDAVRRLVRANDEAIATLDLEDRNAIEDAIATMRKHRATLDATFPVELRAVVRQPTPQLFPTIEADTRQSGAHG